MKDAVKILDSIVASLSSAYQETNQFWGVKGINGSPLEPRLTDLISNINDCRYFACESLGEVLRSIVDQGPPMQAVLKRGIRG